MAKRPVRRSASARGSVLSRQKGVLLHDAMRAIPIAAARLTRAERFHILDAWSLVIDGVYAHLPLKRALYGFDPVRALAHLRSQAANLKDLEFHRELTSLINRLRDAHTQYSGPRSIAGGVARLPFLVESWGPADDMRFIVSKVSDRRLVPDAQFEPGVTLDWWNGVPFGRAVDLHAENETGGRPDARTARALESLTLRALEYGPPPDERWVDIGYTDLKGKARGIRFLWRVVFPDRVRTAGAGRGARMRRGIDPGAEAVRRAKKLMFNRALWSAERPAKGAAGRQSLIDAYADFLTARSVRTRRGTYGYLRIWSFDVDDDQEFIDVAIELLKDLPRRGLIIDLRDNPGGFIWAAERMLQLFTPNDVMPTKFALRATSVTAALAAAPFNDEDLGPWAISLANAPATGEPYSVHLPITPVARCNDLRQHYGGPVVVVVNANTYSSGDLFTAGVLDNRIGPVVCIGEATGAGGANVWESGDLIDSMRAAGMNVPALARGANFTISMRRAVRGGDADGVLIEDAGIAGQPYAMTRQDILDGNADLIEHCAELLAAQPYTDLDVQRIRGGLRITTIGLDHVDVFEDAHPIGPGVPIARDGDADIALPPGSGAIDVVGFAQHLVRQRRRLPRRR